MTMQGCPGEEWALKAYGFYKELLSGQTQEITEACCPIPSAGATRIPRHNQHSINFAPGQKLGRAPHENDHEDQST